MKEENKLKKEQQIKREKPYLSCEWYPDQCNAVGCDCGQGPCIDYKEDYSK